MGLIFIMDTIVIHNSPPNQCNCMITRRFVAEDFCGLMYRKGCNHQ